MKLIRINYIRYGLIMSGITILCLFLMEVTGQNKSFDNSSPIQAFYMFAAPFIVWFMGIRAKKKAQKNKLSFKQGVIEGFKISLVYAIISPFIFLVYYVFVNQSIVEYVRTVYKLKDATNTMVIITDMVAQFVAATVFGTMYAALISLFLKTKS